MITAFLPCRKGSQRVPDKNIRDFCGVAGGLLKIKLDQLLKTNKIDEIILSTNDERILDYAVKINESRLILDERPDYLGSCTTTTDELIQYVPSVIGSGDILWTHVTSPFLNENDYEKIIATYLDKINLGYDSLMTVQKMQGFIWDGSKPVNYNRDNIKWPFTQSLNSLYEVDSGAFLSSRDNYLKCEDRIGNSPFLYCQSKEKSIDIDWPEDFLFAEQYWRAKGK